MEVNVIIRQIPGGWQVLRWDSRKGETLYATLCGGSMGKRLAILVGKHAAESLLCDETEVKLELLK